MAITSAYPVIAPKVTDLIVGTQTYTTANPVLNNPTKNFTIQSIVDLAAAVSGISLTTTGTSGISTLAAGVLNIPNYVADPSIVKTTGNQTIGGAKTFTTNIAAPNVGGNNSGDQSLSISGSVITISGTNSSVTLPSGINTVAVATAASTGAPLSAAILNSELTLTSGVFAGGNNAGYVPSGGTNASFLRGDGTWSSTGTVTSVGLSTDIAAFAVGFANPITTQGTITLNLNGGTSGQFLRQDGTWATPAGGGTVTGTGLANQLAIWTGTGSIGYQQNVPLRVLSSGGISTFLIGDDETDQVLFEATPQFKGYVKDRDAYLGTTGQVLISNNVGEVLWGDALTLGTSATTALAGNTTVITTAQATDITDSVKNNTDTYTSTPPVTKIITLTQAEYTAITTPNVNTLYIII